MRKLLLSIFIIIYAFSAKAQFNVYHPFPDSNAYWRVDSFNGSSGTYISEWGYGYILNGDTSIKGKVYHKVNKVGGYYTYNTSNPGGTVSYYWNSYCASIREDTMKHIYFYDPITQRDTLLYDFNLKVGDTLKQYNLILSLGVPVIITSIDSVLIGPSYRKRFVLFNGPVSIIEGIGGSQGLLDPISPITEENTQLYCFSQNKINLFSISGGNPSDSCGMYYLGINGLNRENCFFYIYPNPASTSITLSYYLNSSNAVLKLYNTMGQLLRSKTISNNNGTINEDVSTLPGGVYYCTLSVDGVVEATNKLAIIR